MEYAERLLVRGAAQLVTLRGPSGPRRGSALASLSIIENGALLIRRGAIEHVGSSHRIENLVEARGAREIDASGKVVLPGLIDCHTRLLASRPAFLGPAPAAAVTASRLRNLAQDLLVRMAAHGTTTAEVTAVCSPEDSHHAKVLRVLQSLDGCPVNLVRSVSFLPAGGEEAACQWAASHLAPLVARRGFARFAAAAAGSDARRYALFFEAARTAGLGLRIYTAPETACTAAQAAMEAGASCLVLQGDPGPAALHALAQSSVITALTPAVGFQLRPACLPPARALIDAGGAVALATGFDAATAPSYSMPMTISLATIVLRMTPEEAIAAATINAAWALGRAAQTGSLEAGKQADFVIANVRDYRELPYYFGVQNIARVFRRGVEIAPLLD